jgi:hypothetical protein
MWQRIGFAFEGPPKVRPHDRVLAEEQEDAKREEDWLKAHVRECDM